MSRNSCTADPAPMRDATVRRRGVLLILLCMLMLAHVATASATMTQEIDAAALLKLIRAERGKVVLVNFFASWCPPCREEIPDLIALRTAQNRDDVILLGVSVDEDPQQLEAMVQKVGFNYPIYRAKDDLPSVFNISSIPRLLIYDPSGALMIDHVGIADPGALSAKILELKGK